MKILIFIYELIYSIFSHKKEEKIMKTTFDEIIEQVLHHEGGYVNDPLIWVVKQILVLQKDFILMWI